MNNVQIKDNFLDEDEFYIINTLMLPFSSNAKDSTISEIYSKTSNGKVSDSKKQSKFLTKNNLGETVPSVPFPWYAIEGIIAEGIIDGKLRNDDHCYNMHMFYVGHRVQSNFYPLLDPILNKIQLKALIRIKANSFSKTEKIIEHGYHRDYGEVKDNLWVSNPVWKQSLTSIFYVNTNNGYTKFKDGTIIESVGNRLLTFPTLMEHTSSTCTDNPTRVNINFNYF